MPIMSGTLKRLAAYRDVGKRDDVICMLNIIYALIRWMQLLHFNCIIKSLFLVIQTIQIEIFLFVFTHIELLFKLLFKSWLSGESNQTINNNHDKKMTGNVKILFERFVQKTKAVLLSGNSRENGAEEE